MKRPMPFMLAVVFSTIASAATPAVAPTPSAAATSANTPPRAHDPGLRPPAPVTAGTLGACGPDSSPLDPAPLDGLTSAQLQLFCSGLAEFRHIDQVVADGLGPTLNLDSCNGCHFYPASGGSSPPPPNPQLLFLQRAQYKPGTNVAPSFITADGPVREVRFIKDPSGKPDGGVHDVFTITGIPGAEGCDLAQPDFAKAFKGINTPGNNAIFRIPTPVFGAGLMEQIEDHVIVANVDAEGLRVYKGMGKLPQGHLNIVRVGHTVGSENRNGNDGTVARFGWKAQNKSLLVFSGEAYNVEMGISNELFQTERSESEKCQFHGVPNDVSSPDKLAAAKPTDRYDAYSDIEKFAAFMRMLAAPVPSLVEPGGADSIARGRDQFEDAGCVHCHTPQLRTSAHSTVAALRDRPVNLYSDLAVHDMGNNLADGVSQGQAGPREFRSAPLWGLGQRIHFLHDGRTSDLAKAIEEHYSRGIVGHGGSEANPVVRRWWELPEAKKQDVLNFLRSL